MERGLTGQRAPAYTTSVITIAERHVLELEGVHRKATQPSGRSGKASEVWLRDRQGCDWVQRGLVEWRGPQNPDTPVLLGHCWEQHGEPDLGLTQEGK